MEKREIPVVAFSIANRFGGAYEESKVKGIAHFIEHMLFTGTKTRSHEDISREVEKKGGVLNAFTAQEITSFWFKMPSLHFFSGINILSDMLNNAVFNIEKFEKEKKVILEEIKMYRDNPQMRVFEMIEENLYEKPFGDGIIGNAESVSALKRDFVYNYWKENYDPANYIVTIVGNADFEKICEYLEKNFQKKIVKRKEELKKIKLINKESKEERAGIDQAYFTLGMHAPLRNEKEYDVLLVLDAYLADGMSSKLFLEIREKRGLAYDVKSIINSEKNYGYYVIYAGTRKEKIDEVKKIILEEFEKLKEMKEKDLEEAKNRLIGLKAIGSEESARVMNELMYSELAGNAEEYYSENERIKKVKLEEVKKLAKKLISKYSTAVIVPK